MPDREKERRIALAIFRGLKRRSRGYVSGEPEPHHATTIDGEFYLMSVAREVLKEFGQQTSLSSRADEAHVPQI